MRGLARGPQFVVWEREDAWAWGLMPQSMKEECVTHFLEGLQALKAVKGILNKLTPEKFERLLTQLVDHVTNADILHGTITLVFENAVAQPTFVAMYSELCQKLSQVCNCCPLPSPTGWELFPPAVTLAFEFALCLETEGQCSNMHVARRDNQSLQLLRWARLRAALAYLTSLGVVRNDVVQYLFAHIARCPLADTGSHAFADA